MSVYQKMYSKLFNAQTDAIAILQKAQKDTEEMYISEPEPILTVLKLGSDSDENGEDK